MNDEAQVVIFDFDEAPELEEPHIQSLKDQGRDLIITDVFQSMLKNGWSLQHALESAGISQQQWRNWKHRGYLDGPLQEISKQAKHLVRELIFPALQDIIKAQVAIAQGLNPANAPGMEVKPNHVVAAGREVIKLLDQTAPDGESAQSETIEQFLRDYQPPQTFRVTRTTETMEFLYTDKQTPTLPELPEGYDDDDE
jgi:hypothetical protein